MKTYTLLLFTLLLILTGNAFAQSQRITVTIAGTGVAGFNGDGNPGISSQINSPYDICADAAHNIYFSDAMNGRIRKLSAKNGMITTVAGGGALIADGVPATSALLAPKNICTDGAGNLYVVASSNQIKRIDAVTNIITTIAGSFDDIFGICIDNSENIYLVDQGSNQVKKIAAGTGIITTIAGTGASGYSGDGGPATSATLDYPTGISVNAGGDIFFADQTSSFNSRIRKVNAATGFISTIAGGGSGAEYGVLGLSANLLSVTGLCSDETGNLYFNEISCSCRKMDVSTDSIYIEGGNAAMESFKDDTNSVYAWMDNPYGLCVDAAQNIYVADQGNNRIRKLIQLTHVPTFALGEGQFINPCTETSFAINTQMSVTDIDFGQTETWTILNAPANGILSGFPFAKPSQGTDSLVLPTGLSYTPGAGFTGADSFSVMVTDGTFADTVMVYVAVSAPPSAGTISSASSVHEICVFSLPIPFSETLGGGTWTMANGNATISATGAVSPVSTGADTIIYTSDFRCMANTTYVVSVVPLPATGIITGRDSVCLGSSVTLADTIAGGVWSALNTNASVSPLGVVSALSAGSDVMFYSLTNVCGSASATKVITIDSSPIAGMSSGSGNICEGSAITLADTITWGVWTASNSNAAVSGGGIINGVSPGVDTIVYTVSNTCGTAAANTIVTINPLPHVGPISCDSTVCIGATIPLTDTVPDGAWSQTNGHGMLFAPGSFIALSAGIDTVVYALSNSCGSASASWQIKVINCNNLGLVNAVPATSDLRIYPNPVSSILNIEWTNWLPQNTLIIEDVTGREISRAEWNNNNGASTMQADASNLIPGIYLIKINGTEVRKFVKQ